LTAHGHLTGNDYSRARARAPLGGRAGKSGREVLTTTREHIDDKWGNAFQPSERLEGVTAEQTPINPRLVNLLGSFIGGTSAYTLARLEFCLEFPERPAPPVLDRLPDASERTLRERWDRIENQLHEILDYVKRIDANSRSSRRTAGSFRSLKRTVRELDQYARALRWVMTVTEQDPAE
jgi:hypothetical protein